MSAIDPVRRLGEWFSDWSLRYVPDPYVVAIVLTILTVAVELLSGTGPKTTLDAWYAGVWTLLPFMATLSVMLMAGDAIAKSPWVTQALERIAAFPDSQFVAVWFTAFVAMATALVSWAIGLIVGAIMARRVAYECRRKDVRVHYPLLAAAGYTGLMIFHSGLSSSAALIMTDPTLIPATFPESVRGGIPLSQTLGSTANLVSAGLLLAVIPVVMAVMHPEAEIRELPRELRSEIEENLEAEPPTETQPEETAFPSTSTPTFADRLNNSQIVGLVIAAFPLYYVINAWFLAPDPTRFVFRPGGLSNLTLNSVNALFLFLAIVLWRRPISVVNQMKESVTNLSGIVFMFPFYAGIAGLLTNTGLAQRFTEVLATVATRATWPVVGVLVSATVNVFIPSGGGQWVAQGPILIETSRQFGYAPWVAVVLEILGDPLTNMIQPFWAIPLLAIADLRARDIIGYTAVAMFVGLLLVCVTVTVFIGLA